MTILCMLVEGSPYCRVWLINRLNALRAFIAVVENGSFAAAARAMNVSSAGVSKNVRELESDLGVRLFHRTTRMMSLTGAGAVYHRRMRKLLAEMDEADAALTALATEPRGTLRVTAPMSIGLLCLSPLVPRFLAEHPTVNLELHFADEKNDLVQGGFDLAIRGSAALPDSTLMARRLATLAHVVIASRTYVERHGLISKPDQLADHACLLYSYSERPGRWVFKLENSEGDERTVDVAGPLLANNSLVLRDAVLAGVGVALMPRLYVEEDFAAGRVVSIVEGWVPHDQAIFAVYPPGPRVLPRVRLFIDFLAKHLGNFEPMKPITGDHRDA